jgi:hypothetical protein
MPCRIVNEVTGMGDRNCSMEAKRSLPWYGWVAAVTLLGGEVGVVLDLFPIRVLFYCIAWWSYIFLVDACVWRRRGVSLVRNRPWEFWFLAFWSVPLWNLFEVFNLRLQNWFYVNVPTESALALLFNVTAYATVLPGLFETYDLLRTYQVAEGARIRAWRVTPPLLIGFVAVGLVMLASALLRPRFAFPLIWGFAIFLGDPLCYWAGPTRTGSLLRQFEHGDPRPFVRLLLAGLVCGGLWEFWNFWAYTKWLYTVPFFENLKWFEMPPLGFLGFPPFAVECYVLVNLLNAVRKGRNWEAWDRTGAGATRPLAVTAIAAALVFNGAVFAGVQAVTVKSIAPTLAEMEGILPDTVEKLGRAGVTTPPMLVRRTATTERLMALAHAAAVPPDELLELRAAARLVDLKGLGAENYNALRRLGIARLEELAQQDPATLLPRWQAEVGCRPPTLAQAMLWVRAARRAAEVAPLKVPGS